MPFPERSGQTWTILGRPGRATRRALRTPCPASSTSNPWPYSTNPSQIPKRASSLCVAVAEQKHSSRRSPAPPVAACLRRVSPVRQGPADVVRLADASHIRAHPETSRGLLAGQPEHGCGDHARARARRPTSSAAQADHPAGPGRWTAPDLIGRNFGTDRLNHKWYGDGTEIPTDEGKLYLDSVLDMGSRRVVGFALGEHHDSPRHSPGSPARCCGWVTVEHE
jgi:hypothetical protein